MCMFIRNGKGVFLEHFYRMYVGRMDNTRTLHDREGVESSNQRIRDFNNAKRL